MRKFTFLELEKILGIKEQLRVFRLGIQGYGCNSTDFSRLLGELTAIGRYEKRCMQVMTKSSYTQESSSDGKGLFYIVHSYGNASITDSSIKMERPTNISYYGARPVFKFSDIEDIPINGENGCVTKREDGIMEVEYGFYPQQAVSSDMQKILETSYNGQDSLKKTENSYTTASRSGTEYSGTEKFSPKSYDEYEYNGKKYVRIIANLYDDIQQRLSNGESYNTGDAVWVEVEPIKWLVDEEEKIMITKDSIFSGIPFFYDATEYSTEDFDKSDIKMFMDNYWAREIEQDRKRDVTLKDTVEFKLIIDKESEKKQNVNGNTRFEEMEVFLKTLAESLIGREKKCGKREVYDMLCSYGMDSYKEVVEPRRLVYDKFNKLFEMSGKESVWFSSGYPYTWLIYDSGDIDKQFDNNEEMIKLYIPADEENLYEVACELFNQISLGRMTSQSKINGWTRADDIVSRFVSEDDAKKICDFMNENCSDKILSTNPFIMRYGKLGITSDGNISYNEAVSRFIAEYMNNLKENEQLPTASLKGFRTYLEKRRKQIYSYPGKLKKFVGEKDGELSASNDIDYAYSNKNVMDFLIIATDETKGIEDFWEKFRETKNPEYVMELRSKIEGMLSSKPKPKSKKPEPAEDTTLNPDSVLKSALKRTTSRDVAQTGKDTTLDRGNKPGEELTGKK